MIFKVFKKKELAALYELLAVNAVVGPVRKGTDRHNQPLNDFAQVYSFADLALDYSTTVHSPKRFVLPYRKDLARFTVNEQKWRKETDLDTERPVVFFGMHACDINALNKLDKVLAESVYPVSSYIRKRRNMFIIGLNCQPSPQCFCRSMGTDSVLHGYDMFLTDLGDNYFAEISSVTAFNLLQQIKCRDPGPGDERQYEAVTAEKTARFTTEVDTGDLTKILDLEFYSPAWDRWGRKCLSCGTCANVCPTCYCYGVEESVDLNLQEAHKTRFLYSCNLHDFAKVAGGHNFRPLASTRLKYRYYHKHRGFVEAFEESLCVGCGRCGAACLAGITPPEVIADVRGKKKCVHGREEKHDE